MLEPRAGGWVGALLAKGRGVGCSMASLSSPSLSFLISPLLSFSSADTERDTNCSTLLLVSSKIIIHIHFTAIS